LYAAGTSDGSYLSWFYADSCSQSGGVAALSFGTCSLLLSSSLTAGNYELRMFANNAYTRLAVSNAITVAPVSLSLAATPASGPRGSNETVAWQGVASPTTRDWLGLYSAGAADGNYLNWIYANSCSQSAGGSVLSAGSCPFALPSTLASGNYELRLFGNNSYTRITVSNPFTVTP
jgi:hypothetical protein